MAIAQAFLDSHIQTHLVRLCSCLHGPETTSLHAPSPSLIRPALGMTSAGAQLFMVFGKKMHALSNPAFVHLVDETIEASQGSRMDVIRSLIWNQITQCRTFECSYMRISPMIDWMDWLALCSRIKSKCLQCYFCFSKGQKPLALLIAL